MLDSYTFEFNDISAQAYGIYVEQRPAFPVGSRKVELITVEGRSEPLLPDQNSYDPIELKIECAFKEHASDWCAKARSVKRWLCGSGSLRLSDSPDTFFKVYNIEIEQIDREIRIYGKFTVKFTCSPFEYLVAGRGEQVIDDVKFNPYDLCHPTYRIRGNGECRLIVNEKAISVIVKKEIMIDTDKMLTYESGEMKNTLLTGDYEDLYLLPGENKIEAPKEFEIMVSPNWRCI